jgi:RimJ/RimL family protein N-acetyltransferase
MTFSHYHIRILTVADLNSYYRLASENRERLEDFFVGTTSRTATLKDSEVFIQEMLERHQAKTYYPFVIEDLQTQQLIGFLDLKNIDWQIPKTELGFYIDQAYEGKGVMSKAFEWLCEYALTQLSFEKLFLRTHTSNTAAQRLALKNGFQLEGTVRKDYKTTSGIIVDLMYFGKLKSE